MREWREKTIPPKIFSFQVSRGENDEKSVPLAILRGCCVKLRRGGGIGKLSWGVEYDYTWQGGGSDAQLTTGANWIGGVTPFRKTNNQINRLTSATDCWIPSGKEAFSCGLSMTTGGSIYLDGTLRLDSTTSAGYSTTYGVWLDSGAKIIQSEEGTGELIIKPNGSSMNQVTLRNGNSQLVFRRGEIVTPWLTVGGDQEVGKGELFQQYGGTVTATSFYVGNNGTGTFEQYGGTVTATTAYFGSGNDRNNNSRTGTGTIHLYGGSFTTTNLRGNVDTNTEVFLHVGETSYGNFEITGSSNYTGKISAGLVNGFVSWQGAEELADVRFFNNTGTASGKEVFQTSELFAVSEDKRTITLNPDQNLGEYAVGSPALSWDGSQTGFIDILGSGDPYTLTLFVTGVEDMTDFLAWLNADADDVTARASGDNAVLFSTFASGLDQTFLFDFTPYTGSDVYAVGLEGNSVPEPASWILLLLGVGFGIRKVGKKR
ncbi:MAG: PEP-CTERM sorting domain-containing protein [Planctomycetia bacterium]|nr:PEP-CTERM sorting domain-containing protein [Planctomycetia bacterium]